MGKFLRWIAGAGAILVGIWAADAADGYGVHGWLTLVAGLIVGMVGYAALYGLFLCWPPFNLKGHVHGCNAVEDVSSFQEFRDGRARVGYKIYFDNQGFADLLQKRLDAWKS